MEPQIALIQAHNSGPDELPSAESGENEVRIRSPDRTHLRVRPRIFMLRQEQGTIRETPMNFSFTATWRRRIAGAFLTWLVPFVCAVPFYGPAGLVIDQQLFKSIMIVIGSITAAILIIWCFRPVEKNFTHEAIVTGFVWLIANWVLDLIVLVGLLGMALPDYAGQIGLRYLVIPAMVIAAGVVADEGVKRGSEKNL